MKKIINFLLVISIILSGCSSKKSGFKDEASKVELDNQTIELYEWNPEDSFKSLEDENLRNYLKDTIYAQVVDSLPDGYFLENVNAVYISKEYIEELSYNSRANVFFGYTLAELDAQFQGQRYVFTLDENGETIVEPLKELTDDTYKKVLSNVAIGAGVILVCATVSVVSAGMGAPAISMIFAMSAKTGAMCAVSAAASGGVISGITTYALTGEIDEAVGAAALGASQGFMMGAITGAIAGGASEAIGLRSAVKYGAVKTSDGIVKLTMNEAATIQKAGYPLDVVQNFSSMEQFNICQNAGLQPQMVNGNTALIRNIDLNFKGPDGLTNLQRMAKGNAALDPATGLPYELHHVGQKMDSTLAILTKAEHTQGGNDQIWHLLEGESQIDREAFRIIREDFWKTMAKILSEGAA